MSPAPNSWSSSSAGVLAAAGAALGAAVLAVLGNDPPGRVLLALAALGLAGVALLGALLRPRLAVDPAGLGVRGLRGTRRLGWPEVASVEVVTTRRLGRAVRSLEITPADDDDILLVLTGADLGADPRDVLARLVQVRDGGQL